MTGTGSDNPSSKHANSSRKVCMSHTPPIAIIMLGMAMEYGANGDYASYDWRENAITTGDYYDAMMRHLLAYFSGENCDPKSKIHHLAHIMASCAILLDAELNDPYDSGNVYSDTRPIMDSQESLDFLLDCLNKKRTTP